MLLKYLESCPLSICVASQIRGTLYPIYIYPISCMNPIYYIYPLSYIYIYIQREREREREIDRQTDRQIDIDIDTYIDIDIDIQNKSQDKVSLLLYYSNLIAGNMICDESLTIYNKYKYIHIYKYIYI